MDDADLRGELLAVFYELRNNAGGWVPTSEMNVRDGAASRGAVASACQQMADADLIDWQPFTGAEEGIFIGRARITGHGVDVMAGSRVPKIDVRFAKASEAVAEPNIQADAMVLLQEIARATEGSGMPVVLEDLRSLPMNSVRPQTAFHYLKSKGLIDANFSIFYAARLSAAGHDAILAASPPETAPQADSGTDDKAVELLTLKPGIWGMSIDLKEAWRRLQRRCKKSGAVSEASL